MEALPPNAAHVTRRAAWAQLFPPSSESQGTRWDSPNTHVHNPWISIPVTVSQVHCFTPLCWKEMTSHRFYWWLYAEVMIFCLPIKQDSPTEYWYQCVPRSGWGSWKVHLIIISFQLSAFSLFASLYHKVEQIFCLFLCPKYVIKISIYLLWKWSSNIFI